MSKGIHLHIRQIRLGSHHSGFYASYDMVSRLLNTGIALARYLQHVGANSRVNTFAICHSGMRRAVDKARLCAQCLGCLGGDLAMYTAKFSFLLVRLEKQCHQLTQGMSDVERIRYPIPRTSFFVGACPFGKK